MKLIDTFRAAAGGYLGRHEARMVGRRAHLWAYYGLAGLVDAAALLALALPVLAARQVGGVEVLLALGAAAMVTALPVAAAVGLLIPAMAGEKADGTLEALMLTPVSRRELLWAKLVGRMSPVRGFLKAAAPAFVLAAQLPALAAAVAALGGGEAGQAVLAALLVPGGLVFAALWWAAVFADAHCAAAVTLYCSARAQGTLSATVAASFAVLAPPVVMSCFYGMGLPYHFVAGPIMFSELIRNLDRFTIERE